MREEYLCTNIIESIDYTVIHFLIFDIVCTLHRFLWMFTRPLLVVRFRRVAFLECDLGQSEFTPGGMVSLHLISRPVLGMYLFFF